MPCMRSLQHTIVYTTSQHWHKGAGQHHALMPLLGQLCLPDLKETACLNDDAAATAPEIT